MIGLARQQKERRCREKILGFLDRICYNIYMVGLAQMVRASECGPEGRRFDPDIPPQ